jgi:hypothetical protein
MRDPFKHAVRRLTAEVSDYQRRIDEVQALIAALSAHADGGAAHSGNAGNAAALPPKKRQRRRRKRNVVAKGANGAATRVPKAAAKRRTVADKPPPVAAPVKAVRGAAQFATELAAVDEIVAALAKADKALNKAGRSKDGVGIAAASEEIHQLRRRGNDMLVRLGGKARLPIDKSERMRWKRAGAMAAPPKPKKLRKPRIPTPPPAPPIKRDSGWHDDGNGVLSREIETR